MKLYVIQQRKLWWAISLAVILGGIVAMLISWRQVGAPLRPSLDFVGGTRLQVELICARTDTCEGPISPSDVRDVLADRNLANSSIQLLGDEQHALSIRTSILDVENRTALLSALSDRIGEFDPQTTQIDTVGPTIGRQLFTSGMLALVVSFVGIMVYLSFRFQSDFAVLAIVALLHDVLVTLGVFAVLGLVLGVEVDSLFIVALLTIVGFSVNDTVVIYDRVRELIKEHPERHINDTVDDAVNQTLTRSINTTFTTVLPLVAIFLFGGETLKYFALALIIGFIAGVYSSIFIASTLLALWRERSGRAFLAPASGVAIEGAIAPDEAS
ncbi:protein translocase subunit SecF [Leptolyngbya sp. AN02str]|uniref:protein translocase subunit SecF n=1 Tax=Leptolyngbya sp. AN02str TaxID=3423363 RepID=UPI003D30F862